MAADFLLSKSATLAYLEKQIKIALNHVSLISRKNTQPHPSLEPGQWYLVKVLCTFPLVLEKMHFCLLIRKEHKNLACKPQVTQTPNCLPLALRNVLRPQTVALKEIMLR